MAATADAIKAGSAYVSLTLQETVTKGLDVVGGKLKNFGAGVGAIGAGISAFGGGIIGTLVAMATKFATTGTEIGRISARTGLSTDAVQVFGAVLSRTGGSMDDLNGSARGMAQFLQQVESGSGAAAATLTQLGISAQDFVAASPDERMRLLTTALAGVDDATRRAALAQDVFGRGGQAWLVALADGAESYGGALREAQGRAKLSPEQVQQAKELSIAWGKWQGRMGAVTMQIGAAFAPALTGLLNIINPLVKQVTDFVRANAGLTVGVTVVAAGLVALGFAVTGVGLAFAAAGVVVGGLTTAAAAAGAVLGAIFSPAGAIVVGVAAVAAAVGYLGYILATETAEGRAALSAFGAAWEGLSSTAVTAWQGILNAVKVGNLRLAFEVAWAAAKLVWAQAINWLLRLWERALGAMGSAWNQLAESMGLGDLTVSLPNFAANEQARRAEEGRLRAELTRLAVQAQAEADAPPAQRDRPGTPAAPAQVSVTAAVERGTREAFSVITRSQTQEQIQRQQLAAQEDAVRLLERMNETLRDLPLVGAAFL